MNLNNFENQIEPKIIDRGFNYFEQESIEEFEEIDENEYSALVLGSDEYSVYIKLNDALEIIDHDCDCPYDWGEFCKHEVAVLYHLKYSKPFEKPFEVGTIGKISKELNQLKKNEIVAIIVELSKRNRNFRNKLMWELGFEVD